MSETPAYKIVLLRHGESTWNQENRFTGWTDVDLSEKGLAEAKNAGVLLKEAGYTFDVAHTSLLRRAIRTLWIVSETLDLLWIPVSKHWRLNERHYGSLQGLNKAETVEKYGEEQVHTWRRSYATPPPVLAMEDPTHPSHDPRYKDLSASEVPSSESLENVVTRFLPYWEETIIPDLRAGKRVLVAAHGNSIRALVKHLDAMSDDEIADLNIPTGVPLVYELDQNFKPIRHYYLGDQAAVEAKIAAVVNQTKKA